MRKLRVLKQLTAVIAKDLATLITQYLWKDPDPSTPLTVTNPVQWDLLDFTIIDTEDGVLLTGIILPNKKIVETHKKIPFIL